MENIDFGGSIWWAGAWHALRRERWKREADFRLGRRKSFHLMPFSDGPISILLFDYQTEDEDVEESYVAMSCLHFLFSTKPSSFFFFFNLLLFAETPANRLPVVRSVIFSFVLLSLYSSIVCSYPFLLLTAFPLEKETKNRSYYSLKANKKGNTQLQLFHRQCVRVSMCF